MIEQPAPPVDAPGRPPRILQVLPELGAGGVPRGAIDVAEAIVRAGGDALIGCAEGPLQREVKRVGARHVALPLATKRPWALRANAGLIADLIRAEKIDLVHARSRAPAWSALKACRATGTPFVTTYHGTYSEGFPGKRLYNSVMARGDRVIAISGFIAKIIAERHKTPSDRVTVIHRGVDLDVFDPEKTTAARTAALADKWRIPDDRP
ncbi:MAG: glycosyltransferase, partial [Pseudomonadota bacterium]